MKLKIKEVMELHNSLQQLVKQDLPFDLMWELSDLHDQVADQVDKLYNRLRKVAVDKFEADSNYKVPDSKYPEYQEYEQKALEHEVNINVPRLTRDQFADVKAKYLTPTFRKIIK